MTFKAMNGWTNGFETTFLRTGSFAKIYAKKDIPPSAKSPCTIIAGHWAERIESGELLTIDERGELEAEWINSKVHVGAWEYMMQAIARKLRGEA